jgi:hypothetical protein
MSKYTSSKKMRQYDIGTNSFGKMNLIKRPSLHLPISKIKYIIECSSGIVPKTVEMKLSPGQKINEKKACLKKFGCYDKK